MKLPSTPHIPGINERPDEQVFEAAKAGLGPQLSVGELANSEAFAAGRDALDRGYFWEAHELWEAVWMCLPPASAERRLLNALIQIANAELKLRMDRPRAAKRIARLAGQSLDEAFLGGQDELLGLSKRDVQAVGKRVFAL